MPVEIECGYAEKDGPTVREAEVCLKLPPALAGRSGQLFGRARPHGRGRRFDSFPRLSQRPSAAAGRTAPCAARSGAPLRPPPHNCPQARIEVRRRFPDETLS
jgi:hypothetical protein